jgi:hypothetical protein
MAVPLRWAIPAYLGPLKALATFSKATELQARHVLCAGVITSQSRQTWPAVMGFGSGSNYSWLFLRILVLETKAGGEGPTIPNPTNPGLNRISKFPASVPTPKGLSLGIGVRGMGRASPGFKSE